MSPKIALSIPNFEYQFDILLAVLSRFAFPARQIIHDNQLWRVTEGELVAYSVTEGRIEIQTTSSSFDATALSSTSHKILGLEKDLTDFYSFAKQDHVLWKIIKPLYGLPIICTETVFEALITLIIEQHISWKNALRSQHTLVEIFDKRQFSGDVTVYDFPSPEQLSQATPEQLKPLKITNRRIDLIINIACDVVDGTLDLESLRYMDTTEAYQTLMKIKGIGHWTAGNVIGRALGRFPYISHNDVALQAAIQHYFYQDQGKKSAQQVIDTLESFGEYGGLVGHFTLLRWVLDRYPVIA